MEDNNITDVIVTHDTIKDGRWYERYISSV